MRRYISLLLVAVILLGLLGGCGGTAEIELMNTTLTIEFTGGNGIGTVTTEDGDVYEFRHSKGVYNITYPDGETYTNRASVYYNPDGSSNREYPDAYEGDVYLSTTSLADAIALAKPKSVPFLGILLSLGLIVTGVVMIVKSHSIMELRLEIRNWHKDPNMREIAHARTVYAGIGVAAVGVLILIITAISAV